jgi:hypothetical protein
MRFDKTGIMINGYDPKDEIDYKCASDYVNFNIALPKRNSE